MDVKSIFLNRILESEVYTEKYEVFVDPRKKEMVCKIEKKMYSLKKAPRSWQERLGV